MKSSAQIQLTHEESVLREALAEHNRRQGLALEVISRPDPPDAMLSDGTVTTWMELTDAFFSVEWARNLSSYGSIKGYKPMRSGSFIDMDKQFAVNFCDLVQKKAGKQSYAPFIARHGPGILVVGLESPWLDDDTMDEISCEWSARGSPDISATFAHVYTRHRAAGDNIVLPWPQRY